jgi:hypothetical protein
METNEQIKSRRRTLSLSETEVARASEIGIDAYWDIEMYSDELYAVVALRSVKALCRVLRLNILELLSIPCSFCEEKKDRLEEYDLPRNELIRRRREKLGFSTDELGERVNYDAVEIVSLESDPDYIEDWRVRDLATLSVALEIPLQVLMHVRCIKCGM